MFGHNVFSTVVGFRASHGGATDTSRSHYNVKGDWVAMGRHGQDPFQIRGKSPPHLRDQPRGTAFHPRMDLDVMAGVNPHYPHGQDLVTGEANPAPETIASSDPLATATFEPGSKVKCHDEDCPPNHHAMTVIDGKGDEKCECMPNDAPHPQPTEPKKKSFWEWLFGA